MPTKQNHDPATLSQGIIFLKVALATSAFALFHGLREGRTEEAFWWVRVIVLPVALVVGVGTLRHLLRLRRSVDPQG